MKFVTFCDKNELLLKEFRENVFKDFSVPEKLVLHDAGIKFWKELCPGRPEVYEELYKFSEAKWKLLSPFTIEAVLYDNKIVSMCAAEVFNSDCVRVCMMLYTLKNYRRVIRDHIFSENGFFARQFLRAKDEKYSAVFLSVYKYNDKLRHHAMNLANTHRSVGGVAQPYLTKLEPLGVHLIKGVEQDVIGLRINEQRAWNQLLPEILQQ